MTRFSLSARTGLAVAVSVLLYGCAAQTAYKEGQALVGQGKTREGFIKLQEAQRLEPGSAEYRIALLKTRDQIIQALLDEAERQQKYGNTPEAERNYREVLAVQANNDRALANLRAIEQQRRADKSFKEAEDSVARKDLEGAKAKLKSILLEVPGHESALKLARKLDEQSLKVSSETGLSAAYKKPITIEFKDAPLRSVFEVISRSSGLNFLFDKDVRSDQKTSIFLKNSTIEAAVNLTLLTNQLDQRVLDANTVLIYANTQAKQRDYQMLTVKSFYLVNAEAKTIAATLKTILKTRDIVVDDKLNMLIVRDSPDAIKLAEKLVALQDVAEPEVMLEVEILEVKRTRLLNLGIQWPDQLSLTPLSATAGGALTLSDLRNLNGSSIGAAIGPVTLNAKKADSDANILANPRIRARNREKAKILIGERVPNITTTSTSTGFVAETVNYVDVGLKLDVEPTVYLDGEVAIKISLEVSNIINQIQTKSGSIAYQIGTRTAQTVLRLKDGENQVLAGLINDEDRNTGNKIPALGDVPVLGRLFGSQLNDGSKTEIVLSITPRILRNIQRPDASALEFDSGTESSLGVRAGGVFSLQGGPALPPIPPAQVANPAAAGLTPPSAAPSFQVFTPAPNNAVPITPGAAEVQTKDASIATTAAASNTNDAAASDQTASGSTLLRWQGPTSLKPGDSFALQLLIQPDQAVFSVPLSLGFDPKALQVISVTEGDFLRQGGAQTGFTSRVEPSGQILITGTRSGTAGATALASFATVNFRVNAVPGPETKVQLLNIGLIGAGGRVVSASIPPVHVIQLSAGK